MNVIASYPRFRLIHSSRSLMKGRRTPILNLRRASDSRNNGSSSESSENISKLEKALSTIENSVVKFAGSRENPKVPLFKSFSRPLFPGFYKAITVTDKAAIDAVNKRLGQNNPYIGIFLSREPLTSTTASDSRNSQSSSGVIAGVRNQNEIHKVGSLCQIYNVLPGPNDSMTLLLYPHRRVTVRPTSSVVAGINDSSQIDKDENGNAALILEQSVEDFRDIESDTDSTALIQETVELLTEISHLNPLVNDQMGEFQRTIGLPPNATLTAAKLRENGNLAKLADFAASMCDSDAESLQELMDCPIVSQRLEKANVLLQKELLNAELQSEIRRETDKSVSERDRVGFLKSRLRSIQKELGLELVAKEQMIDKYRSRCDKLVIPAPVQKVVDDEIAKLAHLRPSSQEYNLTTQYLDWLTQVPWGNFSKENLNLLKAEEILNAEHFGMKDVKERILEFIAVASMRGGAHGKILCLSGAPGVGKTSIGKSIAHALDRKFFRFSVGGLYDVAEIKGHRRTYVGAMPGKLIQALKNVQTQNPLILIDEIDKMSQGGPNGDPAAALLEVLDPEQNSTFVDHYLDVSVDLSKVLFVCTANVLDTIPGPLLDRMEIINVSGYIADEKKEIAKRYLIPKAQKQSGLENYPVDVTEGALEELIDSYCRESGVRNLNKQIERVFRKAALKVVESESKQEQQPICVDRENLKDFVGKPVFNSRRLFENPAEGVIMGLAYNAYGGSTLYIESVVADPVKPKGNHHEHSKSSPPRFIQTGNMGSVMKESSKIAYSYAKAFLHRHGEAQDFFKHSSVHLHVPEGATPKDGPSAGIAMCSSLVSLALGRKPNLDVAMTGELTLIGRVLKIGGLKEKLLAAKRAQVQHIIIPFDNKPDYEELDENIKAGMNVHFVKNFEEVYQLLFR